MPPPKSSEDRPADEIPLYLEALKPIRVLLADQERRAAERSRGNQPPLHLDELGSSPRGKTKDYWEEAERKLGRPLDHGQRIVIVIQWFEETSEPVEWLAKLLRPYRDEAIEPLLNCLENDTRLSRGGRFENPGPGFKLEGVDQLAYSVVCCLLETGFEAYFLHELTRDERKALAERIRAHWHKIRNMSPADGWYEILRDDSQSPDRWVEAVKMTIGYSGPHVRDTKESAARREAMRTKRDPSISELLIKRARSLTEQRLMDQAAQMALALAKWDPEAALPILRQVAARWHEVLLDESPQKVRRIHWIPSGLVKLALARAKLKDPSALKDYLQLFHELEKPAAGEDAFEPLLKYCDAPEVISGAEWMFNDPASPWNMRLPLTYSNPFLSRNNLMMLPAFRKLILRALADDRIAGTANIDAHKQIHVGVVGHTTATFESDPLCPAPGAKVEFRSCDICAWELREILGLPRCELFWPKDRRDSSVAQCSRLLQQYGHLLTRLSGPRTYWAVQFAFPTLDHPATLEDVRNGQAIFSLEGQGAARCCNLFKRPAEARWVTFRDEPYLGYVYDSDKRTEVPHVNYHQDGLIWQAEEVQVAGKWHRYYGFAGAGRMTKAPAEEIEFDVRGYRWDDAFNVNLKSWVLGVDLVNRSGVPQPLPRFHTADDPRPAPSGSTILDFRLYRFEGDGEPSSDASPNALGEDRQWREIPRKPAARLKIERLPAQLEPMEATSLFTVDLDADYPKLVPGYYQDVASLSTMGEGPKRVLRLSGGGRHIRGDSDDR